MAFKKNDIKKLVRGLTPEQETNWKTEANAELRKCVAAGGDELTCEINAVRVATQKIKGSEKNLSELKFKEIYEIGDKFRNAFFENKVDFIPLQEATLDEGWQLILPIGTWYIEWYGEVIFTRRFMEKIVENYKSGILNEREPYVDTDHDGGASNGWITDMRAGDDGLEVKIDWTERGKELLEKKIFKYFSAEISSKLDIETNERIWPVLPAVTLTNRPAMNTLPEASLEDKLKDDINYVGVVTKDGDIDETKGQKELAGDLTQEELDKLLSDETNSTHGDGDKNNQGEAKMNFAELLKEIQTLNEDEKTIVIKELGVVSQSEDIKKLSEENKTLKEKTEKLTGEKEILSKVNDELTTKIEASEKKEIEVRKESAINKALSEGKILPKTKEFWEGKFDENPDFTEEVLAKLPKAVSFGEEGTDDSPNSDTKENLTKEDEIVAQNLKELGLSDEEIKEVM